MAPVSFKISHAGVVGTASPRPAKPQRLEDHTQKASDELLLDVLACLPAKDLASVTLVNRRFHKLAMDKVTIRNRVATVEPSLAPPLDLPDAVFTRATQWLVKYEQTPAEVFKSASKVWPNCATTEAQITWSIPNAYAFELPAAWHLDLRLFPGEINLHRPDLEHYLLTRCNGHFIHDRGTQGPQPRPLIEIQVAFASTRKHMVGIVTWQDNKVRVFSAPMKSQMRYRFWDDDGGYERWYSVKKRRLVDDIVTIEEGTSHVVRSPITGRALGIITRTGLDIYAYKTFPTRSGQA